MTSTPESFSEANPPEAFATFSNPISFNAFVARADLKPNAQNKTIFFLSPIFFLESTH